MDSDTPHGDLSGNVWLFVGAASSMRAYVTQTEDSPTTRLGDGRERETTARRKMYPKEQWLALKPVIQQLYVEEGRTFAKVAEYLQENHGFDPT
jgi:Clr5 domain